jgi:hypothetical protein
MVKFFARTCPRCRGFVKILMREPEHKVPLHAVNGGCVRTAAIPALRKIRRTVGRDNFIFSLS